MAKLGNIIPENKTLFDFCYNYYMKEWNSIYSTLPENASDNKKTEFRREAQKKAVDSAYINALATYPDVDEDLLWDLVSDAHKINLVQFDDYTNINNSFITRLKLYDQCISAHQSWNKTSGHSFERYISNISSEDMQKNEISFLLKSDVSKLIRQRKISNLEEDLHLIQEWNDNFDLYAVQTIHGETHIFGCIQVKTSIRDRVGRDDQFSGKAMDAHFWVAEAVLNGDFFALPKYESMVNGGSITYPENNWHGVYVMTGIDSNKRIYRTNNTFDLLSKHAIIAAKTFVLKRDNLVRSWIAE